MRSIACKFAAIALLMSCSVLIANAESVASADLQSRITFSSNRDGNLDIYTMQPDGSNLINLTHNPADDFGAAWSPDGQQMAYLSKRDGDDEIYLTDAQGEHTVRLT